MIKRTDNAQVEQARRLRIKTQEQMLEKQAVEGTGLSAWEAETRTQVFRQPAGQPVSLPSRVVRMRQLSNSSPMVQRSISPGKITNDQAKPGFLPPRPSLQN
ncbi:MAG: hypothetical protein JXR40_08195 [Pontiellaceae bacterium]|nr:hypothetical protein [Pontiellaceae bacterium]